MTKIVFMFALAFVFLAGAGSAVAAVDCGDGHNIWNTSNSEVVSCISKEKWDKAQAESRNINQDDNTFFKVPRGQKLLTTFGFEDSCPTWYPADCIIKKE